MARKEKGIHYIYKTTCNVTGRWYIGMHSTNNLEDGYMGSGLRLRRSIRKYGVENHTKEILEYCDSREELVFREREIVTNELIGDDHCMNLCLGGTGGFISLEGAKKGGEKSNKLLQEKLKNDSLFKEKWVNKISKSLTKFNDGSKNGICFYDRTNIKHSEETKNLISESSKGNGKGEMNSQYGTCWITKDSVNKKINKEELDQWLIDGWSKGRKIN